VGKAEGPAMAHRLDSLLAGLLVLCGALLHAGRDQLPGTLNPGALLSRLLLKIA